MILIYFLAYAMTAGTVRAILDKVKWPKEAHNKPDDIDQILLSVLSICWPTFIFIGPYCLANWTVMKAVGKE